MTPDCCGVAPLQDGGCPGWPGGRCARHSGAMSAVGIVLVDDHPAVRAGLEGLLDEEDGVTILAAAATGREGYEAILTLRPDAVVVDHHLPDESGLTLCLRVQALDRAPRVVVYSAFADARLRVLGVIRRRGRDPQVRVSGRCAGRRSRR